MGPKLYLWMLSKKVKPNSIPLNPYLPKMSVSTKLGNKFLHIPKLDISGNNWVIFKDHFIWALDACGILDHIDGTSKEPADLIMKEERAGSLTEEQKKLDIDWERLLHYHNGFLTIFLWHNIQHLCSINHGNMEVDNVPWHMGAVDSADGIWYAGYVE